MNTTEKTVEIRSDVRLLDGNRIEYRSRVKFRALPASRDLHQSLLRSGAKQVIFQHENSGHRLTCWPVDDELLVLEVSDTGALTEAPDLKFAHDLMAEAQVYVLGMLDGYAEPVSPRDFDATEPLVARARGILHG
jgi:hypothetical protein